MLYREMDKLCYIHTLENLLFNMKTTWFIKPQGEWKKLKDIVLNESILFEEALPFTISITWHLRKDKTLET